MWRTFLEGILTRKSGTWDEAEHPRHPAGSERGGEFARKEGMEALNQDELGEFDDVDLDVTTYSFANPGELENTLIAIVDENVNDDEFEFEGGAQASTFADHGFLTRDAGVVVKHHGKRYQIQVGIYDGAKTEREVVSDLLDVFEAGVVNPEIEAGITLKQVGALTNNRGVEWKYKDGTRAWLEILGSWGEDD